MLHLCHAAPSVLRDKLRIVWATYKRACGLASLSQGLLCVLGRIVLLSGGGCPPNYLGCVSVSRAVCASFVNSFTYIFVWSMLITNSNSNLSQWQSQKRNPQPRRNGRSTTRPSTESITPVIEWKRSGHLETRTDDVWLVKEGSRRVTASTSTIRTVIPRTMVKGTLEWLMQNGIERNSKGDKHGIFWYYYWGTPILAINI